VKRPNRWQRIALRALGVTALALWTRSGRADHGRLLLAFNAPPECGSAAEVEAAVATMVRRDGPRLEATIDVAHAEQGYVAVVRTHPAAERRLVANDCRALVEATSVVLALAIDPNARRAAAPRGDAPPAPVSSSDRRPLALAAGLGLDTSTLPRAALGATVGAGVVRPGWSGWLRLSVWDSQDTFSDSRPTRGGHFGWWNLALSLCAAPLRQDWARLCLSPEVGRLSGAGIGDGVSTRLTASALWLAVGAGPAVEWWFANNWGLRGEAMAALTLLGRHPFIVELGDSAQLVHRPGRLSARLYWGLAARF
jgi:hypothetical protein